MTSKKKKVDFLFSPVGFLVVAIVVVFGTALMVTNQQQSQSYQSSAAKSNSSCVVEDANNNQISTVSVGQTYTVYASGIPIGATVNLFKYANGVQVSGTPLGSTATGTYQLSESYPTQASVMYQFTGPTKKNFSATTIYAQCSVTVQ